MAEAEGEPDDEIPTLSSDAITALQEFYAEKELADKRFEDLKAEMAQSALKTPLTMEMFLEDWNASQFWYSNDTAMFLAKQLLKNCTTESQIAVVSAPSVFVQLKNLLTLGSYPNPKVYLLEYDKRFNVFQEFVHYDYQFPTSLPAEIRARFDRIICDPPFLSADCQTKAAITVRWLSKPHPTHPTTPTGLGTRIIVCTGERMEDLILKLYPGIHTTSFEPQHSKDRLSNSFRCYANYHCDEWIMR